MSEVGSTLGAWFDLFHNFGVRRVDARQLSGLGGVVNVRNGVRSVKLLGLGGLVMVIRWLL
jgi:hypothetical protein